MGEALAGFRRANRLAGDEDRARWWFLGAADFAFPLPNFGWRRRAIDAHDLHHLLTGYPCTVAGELSIAAWEFGAGRYPHWGATLFCGPLVLAGLIWAPRETCRALARGRRSRSLYAHPALARLAEMKLAEARAWIGQRPGPPEPRSGRGMHGGCRVQRAQETGGRYRLNSGG